MDIQTVKQISGVAKIKLTDEEIATIANEMGQLLDYFKKVQEIKTEEIGRQDGEKSGYMHEITNTFREDEIFESDDRTKEAIRNEFTKKEEDLLIAPKSLK